MTEQEIAESRATTFADMNYNEPDNYGTVKEIGYHAYYCGFLAGFEMANKANKWYKPSEKLPKEGSLVLAYVLDETEPTICEYVTNNQWDCLPKRFIFCSNEQVRMWKELALPKEN